MELLGIISIIVLAILTLLYIFLGSIDEVDKCSPENYYGMFYDPFDDFGYGFNDSPYLIHYIDKKQTEAVIKECEESVNNEYISLISEIDDGLAKLNSYTEPLTEAERIMKEWKETGMLIVVNRHGVPINEDDLIDDRASVYSEYVSLINEIDFFLEYDLWEN